jgi:hypothetical protein
MLLSLLPEARANLLPTTHKVLHEESSLRQGSVRALRPKNALRSLPALKVCTSAAPHTSVLRGSHAAVAGK